MPLFTQVPNSATAGAGNFVVPMDDENSWWWYMTAPALAPGEPVLAHGQLTPGDPDPSIDPTTDYIPGTWRRIRNRANDYLIDREMQRGVNYTGVPGNRVQDALATESMGRRFDHADEHLGTTDVAIIYFRRYLMRLARQLGQGIEPAMAHDPRKFRVLPLDTMDPNGELAQVWEAHHAAYPKGSPLSVLA
jgi:hypothetical protein